MCSPTQGRSVGLAVHMRMGIAAQAYGTHTGCVWAARYVWVGAVP